MRRAKKISSYLLSAACLLLAAGGVSNVRGQTGGVTVFEGARLITGDGNTIENSAFIVENNGLQRSTARGRRSRPGCARRPQTNRHAHDGRPPRSLRLQNVPEGTMSREPSRA
jgi:hypothetical protein